MRLLAGVAMVGLALAGAEAWASVLFEEDSRMKNRVNGGGNISEIEFTGYAVDAT